MSINYNPKIVTDGLVLYLDAANPKSYPGTGTSWYDLSGNGNNGTMTGSPTYTSGKISFDGTDDYVSLSVPTINNSDISFCSWIKKLSNPSSYSQIIGNNNPQGALYVGPTTGGIFCQFTIGGSTLNSGTYNMPLNEWHYIVGTWKTNDYIKLYVDGVWKIQSGVTYSGIPQSFSNIYIGRYSGGTYFNAEINNSKIYNRALSATEILQNFNAIRGRYGI